MSGTSGRAPTLMKMRLALSVSPFTLTVSGDSNRACPRITRPFLSLFIQLSTASKRVAMQLRPPRGPQRDQHAADLVRAVVPRMRRAALHEHVAGFHQRLALVHRRMDFAGEDHGIGDGVRLVHAVVARASAL